jgi:polysaccharide deacetylase family protein (PEP-CTERM system associated)
MLNALTIDVEDWRQLMHRRIAGEVIHPDPAVIAETDWILNVLSQNNTLATFFALGSVASAFPDLIRRIDDAGHEIASHGFSHTLVYLQTPEQFRNDTKRAKELLESIIGKPLHGYRAAEFSITRRSWWALDILAEEGFLYDSSIFPIVGRRYGVPDSPLGAHPIRTSQGNCILEFPLAAVEWHKRRWPVGGGGYFRLLPYRLTKAAIRHVNQQGRPAIVYFHPYDFATSRLQIAPPGHSLRSAYVRARFSTLHNFARNRMRQRLTELLNDFEFAPVAELVQNV